MCLDCCFCFQFLLPSWAWTVKSPEAEQVKDYQGEKLNQDGGPTTNPEAKLIYLGQSCLTRYLRVLRVG